MPVLNGARAWLETPTTLKVPEFNPSVLDNKAMSYIVARPGEPFSLRYDHIPLQDYDVAWKLSIRDHSDGACVEQWGGPPLEMRKSKGIVKVRAMRISEDGTRFREFAWANRPTDASQTDGAANRLQGTITLSLHLCHFAEATAESSAPANHAAAANAGKETANMTGKNALHSADQSHPILAPPTTRPQGSKLWTWYWRDEEPRAVFQFTYATKEVLQAEGIIPTQSAGQIMEEGQMLAAGDTGAVPRAVVKSASSSGMFGHKPRMSHGSLFTSSPKDLIRRKQSLSISKTWQRQRGLSTSSTDSTVSSASEEDESEMTV